MHFYVSVHVCICVCTCMYMSVYMRACTRIYGHVNVFTHIYVIEKLICVSVRVFARKIFESTCARISLNKYLRVSTCVCLYACVRVCLCMCNVNRVRVNEHECALMHANVCVCAYISVFVFFCICTYKQ